MALLLGCGISKALEATDVDASAEVDASDDASGVADADAMASPGCLPPMSYVCQTPPPSFANEIVSILDARCNDCHADNDPEGPWPLHDYQDVRDWKGVVLDSLLNCTMPPPDAGTTLLEDERQRVFAWLACDAPDN